MIKWYLKTIFNAGYVAAANGLTAEDNPHRLRLLREKWCEGYYSYFWDYEEVPPIDYVKEIS